MAYSYQTFSVGQVLTAAQVQQIEDNIRDHEHGQDGVNDSLAPGFVMAYAGSTEPDGWIFCYGQAISRTTFADLFGVTSTQYGVGDGSTTFNVPDLRGRVIAGRDDMGGAAANRLTNAGSGVTGTTLGNAGGAETVTLATSAIPAHAHDETGNSIGGGSSAQVNRRSDGNGTSQTTIDNTGNTGGGGAHNNVQPTIILNYVIKT
jgi:microcystin-dependent protein